MGAQFLARRVMQHLRRLDMRHRQRHQQRNAQAHQHQKHAAFDDIEEIVAVVADWRRRRGAIGAVIHLGRLQPAAARAPQPIAFARRRESLSAPRCAGPRKPASAPAAAQSRSRSMLALQGPVPTSPPVAGPALHRAPPAAIAGDQKKLCARIRITAHGRACEIVKRLGQLCRHPGAGRAVRVAIRCSASASPGPRPCAAGPCPPRARSAHPCRPAAGRPVSTWAAASPRPAASAQGRQFGGRGVGCRDRRPSQMLVWGSYGPGLPAPYYARRSANVMCRIGRPCPAMRNFIAQTGA